MNTKPCVFCGNPTPQVEGRKSRKYCSDTCRQKDWQAKNKSKAQKQVTEVPPETQSDFKKLWDSEEVDKIQPPKTIEEAIEIVDIATKPPVTFQDYLNAIKLETWTHPTLKNFLKTEKHLTSGQKSMIYSKLK